MNNFRGRTKCKGSKLALQLKDYRKIRKVIRKECGKFKGRNLLLVSLQTNTSLRVSDVLKLTVGDIYRQERYLLDFWIEQKKTKELVYITILDCILKDIKIARKEYETNFGSTYFENPQNPLFPSNKRDQQGGIKPLSYSAYLTLLKGWIFKINLNPDLYGTHSLRAAIPAVYYFKNKADILTACNLFGHKDIMTTRIYFGNIEKVKANEVRKKIFFAD